MSGHNKWSTIKHKKAAADSKRGKIFTKIIRELTMAAREGGGDPESNARLRSAIAAAKQANMPADTMKRALQRGTGELEGAAYEEFVYEGYGPGGVAVLLEIVTDNKNRTASEIRHIFSKHGGNLGESGTVRHLFDKKGVITVPKSAIGEDALMELVLEAGALDMSTEDDESYEITTEADLSALEGVKQALEEKQIEVETAELAMVPSIEVPVEDEKANQILKMMDAFEEHDDVKNVWANFDIDPALLETT